MEVGFRDDDNALDSMLESTVVELDAALRNAAQQEDPFDGLENEPTAFQKLGYSYSGPASARHEDWRPNMFVAASSTDMHHLPFEPVVSDSTTASSTAVGTEYVYSDRSSTPENDFIVSPPPPPSHQEEKSTLSKRTIAKKKRYANAKNQATEAVGDEVLCRRPRSRTKTVAPPCPERKSVGRWRLKEKMLFLYGLKRFGKGHWKQIQTYIPGRTVTQIKSHAQKVLKRIDAGENVFRWLEENTPRVEHLLSQGKRNSLSPSPPQQTGASVAVCHQQVDVGTTSSSTLEEHNGARSTSTTEHPPAESEEQTQQGNYMTYYMTLHE